MSTPRCVVVFAAALALAGCGQDTARAPLPVVGVAVSPSPSPSPSPSQSVSSLPTPTFCAAGRLVNGNCAGSVAPAVEAPPATTTTEAAPVETATEAAPVETTDDGAADAYYKNCAAARAAGAAPLYWGDPGYRRALDRDGDGVACE